MLILIWLYVIYIFFYFVHVLNKSMFSPQVKHQYYWLAYNKTWKPPKKIVALWKYPYKKAAKSETLLKCKGCYLVHNMDRWPGLLGQDCAILVCSSFTCLWTSSSTWSTHKNEQGQYPVHVSGQNKLEQ